MPSPSPQFEPEPPRLDLCHTGGVSQVRFPRGRVDGVAVRELFEAAMALTDTPSPKLLIDLTGVSMLPSGAVGIVITIRKKFLQYGGQVHLAGAEPQGAERTPDERVLKPGRRGDRDGHDPGILPEARGVSDRDRAAQNRPRTPAALTPR